MRDFKRLIAGFAVSGAGVKSLSGSEAFQGTLPELASAVCAAGADQVLILDASLGDDEHEQVIGMIKETARQVDEPIFAGGRVKRLEDVKKYLYAGASAVFLDGDIPEQVDLIKEASDRFGPEKIYVRLPGPEWISKAPEYAGLGAWGIILTGGQGEDLSQDFIEDKESKKLRWILAGGCAAKDVELAVALLSGGALWGLAPELTAESLGSFMELKAELASRNIPVDTFRSSIGWEDFKKGSDGLVPVVVQDYRTLQVLMVAYMNQEAFEATLRMGKMNYYSRSRKSQWLKGESSGHFQYVKSLETDCDRDTILALVHQIGPACHTGNTSCFFTNLVRKDYRQNNPLKVFEEVMGVILDRKEHPKEGSYTNYLFDKGIDKILKKLGEEATEIVIAAKNPNPEEVKYEMADFLYHMMVLMAQKGITWEEITKELADR